MTVILKMDLKNGFNMVSHQAVLSECAKHFPELLLWAIDITHSSGILWVALHCCGHIRCFSSCTAVDTSDASLLHCCGHIRCFSPALLWTHQMLLSCTAVNTSDASLLHCCGHIRCFSPALLWTHQMLLLLHCCGHIRSCNAVVTSHAAWRQSILALSNGWGGGGGGLGLCFLYQHAPVAYIASICSSGFGSQTNPYPCSAVADLFLPIMHCTLTPSSQRHQPPKKSFPAY